MKQSTAETRFVSQLSVSISNCTLYSIDHAMTERSVSRAVDAFDALSCDRLELMVVQGELVIDRAIVKDPGLHGRSVVNRFRRKGISRVDFLKGVSPAEIKVFIDALVNLDSPLPPAPHIVAGTIAVTAEKGPGDDIGDSEEFIDIQIQQLREIYSRINPFKKLEVMGLEEIIANFIYALKMEANVLRIISPVKVYSEYTYTHASNVALLSLSQARALGIHERLLHDIGIAALMHDVGKLFISREVLHKKGTLSKEEFDEMKRHPAFGAHYLARIEGLSRLVPIAAYEHHRKYDGSGYPGRTAQWSGQHECSQIIAISDFFDALRSNRPYREGWSIERILSLMREEAGTSFNPFLVANFEALLSKALGSLEDGEEA